MKKVIAKFKAPHECVIDAIKLKSGETVKLTKPAKLNLGDRVEVMNDESSRIVRKK